MKDLLQRIEIEKEHISDTLRSDVSDDKYKQLYAAQQALSWVLSEWEFNSPYNVIMNDLVWDPFRDEKSS